jgi:uncharacterized protein (TIGR02246 family)
MTDDEREVHEANARFYRALEELDYDAMASVWAKRDEDVCIHPGWAVLEGWHAVRESWRAIFAGTEFMRFAISDARVQVLGEVARVTCVENIWSLADGRSVHSQVAATNLFVRSDGGWRITLHHGSPIAGSTTVAEGDGTVN